jgi:hypothetical protein
MELTVGAGLAALADITFVVGFTGIEVMQYTLRERTTRIERRAHSLPERRYSAEVASPLTTVVAGAGAGAGASIMASVHEGWFTLSLGWAVLMATLIPFFCYLVNRAAGINPRPVTRARLRRLLADTARRLDSCTGSLTLAEAAQIRDSLARVMHVGDRLIHQSQTWRWREAIRREQRLLTGAVMLSALFWLVTGSLAAVRLSHGDHQALPGLGISITLAGALVAGTFLRGTRYRRDRHDLGVELRTHSAQLLTRLEAFPSRATPGDRRTNILGGFRATALLGLLDRTHVLARRRQSNPEPVLRPLVSAVAHLGPGGPGQSRVADSSRGPGQ